MKVLFTGGGTLGPVTPLLAIAEAWKKHEKDLEIVWVGTRNGPEKDLVRSEQFGAEYFSLPKARLPRYPSIEWIALPFRLLLGFIISSFILGLKRPDVVISAGGYTSVPIVIAAALFRIPRIVHQQDVDPLLTNRLVRKFSTKMTVSWKETLPFFEKEQAQLVGNPVRESILNGSVSVARNAFGLRKTKLTVLVFGGGTGATWINDRMEEIAKPLSEKANVIHVTGKGKLSYKLKKMRGDYHAVELLTDTFKDMYAVADVVVCRAGLGTITELSALKKAAIMIPLPKSPQESNIRVLGNAVVALEESSATAEDLLREIESLLDHPARRKTLGDRMHNILRTDSAGTFIDLAKQSIQK